MDYMLGERIHIAMPMQVHIASSLSNEKDKLARSMPMSQFMCLNVILTNHGAYLVDDAALSFEMDPKHLQQV